MLFQGLVTVQDVAVSLTWEEWERLGPAQRDLYRESAPKDYGNAVSPSKCPAFACFQLCDSWRSCFSKSPSQPAIQTQVESLRVPFVTQARRLCSVLLGDRVSFLFWFIF